jgi:hypothetical protein
MADEGKVPYIDVDEMREQIVEFYGAYPLPETLFAILSVLYEKTELLEEVEEKMFEHRESEAFDDWRASFKRFGDRMEWYADAAEAADDPVDAHDVIAPPLFEGEYPEDLEDAPEWPDIETVWRSANDLVIIADKRDLDETSLEEMREHYKKFVEIFWASVGDEISHQAEGEGDEDPEIQQAIDAAHAMAESQPDEVVTSRLKGEGKRSIAPLLLAAGAILLMAKRKSRR